MRFKCESEKVETKDTRLIKKFAWLPTKLTDENVIIWLESYTCFQVYTIIWYIPLFHKEILGWDTWEKFSIEKEEDERYTT